MQRALEGLRTPVGRGLAIMMLTTGATGFAMAAQGNIVSNFFEQVLHLSGPEFGYITAIREIPGFLLIFLTAFFYRLSLQRLTAGALILLAVGYVMFGTADSFWSVAPWVIVSSMGYHTWLQTQHALGMSLVAERRTGSILGRIQATSSAGALLAMIVVLITFATGWLSYTPMYIICGAFALLGAVAIFFFPTLVDGRPSVRTPKRDPIVLRGEYKYYYMLNLLDGGRQQIFFSFGPWVLVHVYGLNVPTISAVAIGVTTLSMTCGPYLGRLIDRRGEKRVLAIANVGYVVALAGYALAGNIGQVIVLGGYTVPINVALAIACYVIYSFIFPLSHIGASTYLRKVAARDEVAPSLAMGITMQHLAAVVVPLATGYVLNFVGYQVPFLVACGFACLTFFATNLLSSETQKSPRRLAEDAAAATREAEATPAAAPGVPVAGSSQVRA
jgi:predicted MFS family arabinose efflux permease